MLVCSLIGLKILHNHFFQFNYRGGCLLVSYQDLPSIRVHLSDEVHTWRVRSANETIEVSDTLTYHLHLYPVGIHHRVVKPANLVQGIQWMCRSVGDTSVISGGCFPQIVELDALVTRSGMPLCTTWFLYTTFITGF